MKIKFTTSMVCKIAAGKRLNIKKRYLLALICVLLSFYASTSYAQTRNARASKSGSPENVNDLYHLIQPWFLRGNSGTNPSVNFIGTRDAMPLVFKVNNQKAGYIDFDSVSRNTTFGYQCLKSNVVSNTEGLTGSSNSAFGYSALFSNISGELNTALGANALHYNTEGNVNTSIGGFSLSSNTTGAFNTAIGSFALFANSTGGFNSANGAYALFSNSTGSFNIANGTPFTLSANTEGSDNIATGSLSMNSNPTGNKNVA